MSEEENPAAPDQDAVLKANIQRTLAFARLAHDEVLGEGLVVSAGTIDMLIGAVRVLSAERWPAPAPSATPEAPPPDGGTNA